jgi:hypothetical protein
MYSTRIPALANILIHRVDDSHSIGLCSQLQHRSSGQLKSGRQWGFVGKPTEDSSALQLLIALGNLNVENSVVLDLVPRSKNFGEQKG